MNVILAKPGCELEVQEPFVTTALNCVPSVWFVYVYVVEVFTMSVQVVPPFIDFCHFVIVPVYPVSVKVPLVPPDETDPPVGEETTETVAVDEYVTDVQPVACISTL